MRRRWLILAGCAGAAVVIGAAALSAAGSAPVNGAEPAAAATPPGRSSGPASPTAPTDGSQAVASRGAAPGACPSGGLEWKATSFSAVPVDPAASEWLVQEHGQVSNDSAAAVVLGDGVGRVGRTSPPGRQLSQVVDLALTPAGSVVLSPGQVEPFSAAQLVVSATSPRDLGLGLSDASWVSAAVASGCPGPGGASPGQQSASNLD